jgi:hypothetical protein
VLCYITANNADNSAKVAIALEIVEKVKATPTLLQDCMSITSAVKLVGQAAYQN